MISRNARRADGARRPPEPPPYPSEKARGGEIILRTRLRRLIFIGGLATLVVIVLLLSFWR